MTPKTNPKARKSFFCRECGGESAQWFGRCPTCGAWNTLVEAPAQSNPVRRGAGPPRGGRGAAARSSAARGGLASSEPPRKMGTLQSDLHPRLPFGIGEIDRALGGGLVPGSVVLLGGDPGVGKSTLAMQAAGRLAASGVTVLYVTGEESRGQVQLRATRIAGSFEEVLLAAESDVGVVEGWAMDARPALLVVDSIQTAYCPEIEGAPGSLAQVRESGLRYHRLAKEHEVAVLLIGHVTKEGAIAGPRLLEHMVDTVLYLEGERIGGFRVLRAVKNRFGSTDEIGLFEMRDAGMVEVVDPSRLLAGREETPSEGRVVVATIEGTRPILLEVQALVSQSAFGMPQRVATGIDPRRLAVLLAVLQKHAGVDVSAQDVFVNVVSGIRITEPAADLGVLIAVASGRRGAALPSGIALFGEVGLGGEVRAVAQADRRVGEALRIGFEMIIVPHANWKDLSEKQKRVAQPVRTIGEALQKTMGGPDRQGPDRQGPDRQGVDRQGVDRQGVDRQGVEWKSVNRRGGQRS